MSDAVLKHVGTYRWKSGIEYHGEFLNSQPHGQGTMTFPNGNRYVGSFVSGKRHGHGVFTWGASSGGSGIDAEVNRDEEGEGETGVARVGIETYNGQFVANERHGYGVYHATNGDVYEGEFFGGKKQGEGVLRMAQGDIYRGQFSDSKRSGFGRVEYKTGNSFEGLWVADRRSGKGKFYWANGDSYEGEYLDDKQQGEGTLRRSNGDTFSGAFKDNHVHGFAAYSSHSKGLNYEGHFFESRFHGHGILVSSDGSFYEGEFVLGQKHGSGVSYYSDSDSLFREDWQHNLLIARIPTRIVYDARGVLKKRGLHGPLADKIVELRTPAPVEPAPYSITKEAIGASPSSLIRSRKTGSRSGSRGSKQLFSSSKSAANEPKLQLNISGALNEKGGIPSEHYKVILYLFSFLTSKDLLGIMQVCKAWKFFIADSEVLWELLCKRKWTDLHPRHKPLLPTSWKLLYRTKSTLFIKDAFRHGFGSFYWPNGNKYEGEWVDNKRHGIGAMWYGNKDLFYGDFRDGRKHGTGVYKFFNGTVYEGSWEKGRLHGRVKVTYCNGDRFDGIFFRGEKMGEGTMIYAKGHVIQFIGQWRRGRREGNGREITRSGEQFDSIWLNGNPIVEPKEEPVVTEEYHDWESTSTSFEEERSWYRQRRAERTTGFHPPHPAGQGNHNGGGGGQGQQVAGISPSASSAFPTPRSNGPANGGTTPKGERV